MPFSPMELLLGLGLPILVSAVVSLVIRLVPWSESLRRQSAGFALGAAFFLGVRLIELSDWLPTQPWMWFPYAVLVAALCGPLSVAPGVSWFERFVLYAVLSTIAAWMLVPTWSSLEPSRWVWWVGTAATMTVVGLGIELIASREKGTRLSLLMFAVVTIASVLVMLSGSARFAQFLMAFAGGLFGFALTSWLKARDGSFSGAGLATAFALVGMLMTAKVNSFSKIPFASYAALAAIPVLLAFVAVSPAGKGKGRKGWLPAAVVVCLGGMISLGLALAYDPSILEYE